MTEFASHTPRQAAHTQNRGDCRQKGDVSHGRTCGLGTFCAHGRRERLSPLRPVPGTGARRFPAFRGGEPCTWKRTDWILGEQSVGESDRLVTVLTRDEGVLRAFARQAKRVKSAKLSATQLFCYSRAISERGGKRTLLTTRGPLSCFSICAGIWSIWPWPSIFASWPGLWPRSKPPPGTFCGCCSTRSIFCRRAQSRFFCSSRWWRCGMLSFAGYMPNLVACCECGRYLADPMYFYPARGELACPDCAPRLGGARAHGPAARCAHGAAPHRVCRF